MQTVWKIDVAMVDSMGDPLHNVMHSMGTDSVMGGNTVCYNDITGDTRLLFPWNK